MNMIGLLSGCLMPTGSEISVFGSATTGGCKLLNIAKCFKLGASADFWIPRPFRAFRAPPYLLSFFLLFSFPRIPAIQYIVPPSFLLGPSSLGHVPLSSVMGKPHHIWCALLDIPVPGMTRRQSCHIRSFGREVWFPICLGIVVLTLVLIAFPRDRIV